MMAKLSLPRTGTGILLTLLCCTGCTYLRNRGNDTRDIADIGFSFTKRPSVALYFGFCTLTTLGYAHLDGSLVGNAGRHHFGVLPMRYHNAGALLWGEERMGYVDYKPDDPDSPPLYRTGAIGLHEGPRPTIDHVSCPKIIHLGWVGIGFTCRLHELGDFILGWTTLDVMGDDTAGKPATPAKQ